MLHGKTASKKRGKKERGAGKREGGKQGLCWRFSPSVLFLSPVSQTVGPQTGCPRTCLLPRPAQRLSLFSRADACSQGAAELCLPVSPGRTHRPTIASSLGKGTHRALLPASLLPLAAHAASLASSRLVLFSHGHVCTWTASCSAQRVF